MRALLLSFILLSVSACSQVELASHVAKQVYKSPTETHVGDFKVGTPYKIAGKRYRPKESYDLVETGIASWYGPNFHGKKTANGEIFNQYELTAAHRTLQMPSIARVTNLENGRTIIVRINDRGPFSKGRVLDLSKGSAEALGFKNQGTVKIRLEVLRDESLQVANLAKNGQSTRGFEVALNERTYTPSRAVQAPTRIASVRPAPQTLSSSRITPQPKIASSQRVPSVQAEPLSPPSPYLQQASYRPPVGASQNNVLIQTASFSDQRNAFHYARRLERITQSRVKVQQVQIGDKEFFRVQIPAQNMEEAGNMVQRLKVAGYDENILIKPQ